MRSESLLPETETLCEELDLIDLSLRGIRPPQRRTHYRAAMNWLTRHRVSAEASSLDQVRGLLEAFQHLCAVDDFQRASQLLTIRLRTETQEELHNQLYTWGYCQEQIELYTKLLGKIDNTIDSILLHGLGLAYRSLGDYSAARNAYERSLQLAYEEQDLEGVQAALCNLGTVYCLLEEYPQAIESTSRALLLARRSNDVAAFGTIIGSLGLIYQAMEDYQRAADCHHQYLTIAQRLADPVAEMHALAGLGIACHQLLDYAQAIVCQQQSLDIALAIGDRFAEGTALGNLAAAYQALEQPEVAERYARQHLAIAIEIGDRAGEARARSILQEMS